MRFIKYLLLFIISIVCILGACKALYPDDFDVGMDLIGSFLRNEVVGEMAPFQERVISTKLTLDGKHKISSVCRRNLSLISGSTIYLDVVDLEAGTAPMRFFVADKDVIQDCTSFEIESMEPSDHSLTVNFLQNQTMSVELP